MLFEAMRRAGTVSDSDKVRIELEKIKDFPGALAIFAYFIKINRKPKLYFNKLFVHSIIWIPT
jgi:hypothetical protein